MVDVTYDEIEAQAVRLSALNKVRLMEKLAAALGDELIEENKPLDTLYGLCADLGTAPSEEDIAEVRREVWSNFPREDC